MKDPDFYDVTKPYDYRKLDPPVPMFDPLPKELLRNMPPWVGKLQTVAYCLMAPWGIMLFVILYLFPLLQRFGVL